LNVLVKNKRYTSLDFIKIPLKVCPIYTIIIFLNRILSSLVPAINVLITARFVDATIASIKGGDNIQCMPYLLAYMLVILYCYLQGIIIGNFVNVRYDIKMFKILQGDIIGKTASLKYKYIENPKVLGVIERVSADPLNNIATGMNNLFDILDLVVRIGALLVIVWRYAWWMAFVLLFFSIISMKFSMLGGKHIYEAGRKMQDNSRMSSFYGFMLMAKNINMVIKNNESVALVGENGSGKSTLTKIISGLYEPTEGKVYICNAENESEKYDLAKVNKKQLFKNMSGVFQQFGIYLLSLKDNIQIGQFERHWNEGEVEKMCKEIQFDVNSDLFPNRFETMIGREFGGVELSLGQWQRVAILRGLYRKHNMIILDEPTASIDPIEETVLYKQFANMTKDKTSVLVTHRLGSVKSADRILVLDNGCIVQDGSHKELISEEGMYKEMFRTQEQWYV